MSPVFILDDLFAVIRAIERLPVLVLMVGVVVVTLVLREL
jgi:hypothetical protein